MTKNLELWNKVARPPKEALKTIKGGRLSGMTDVNPQWRLKVMTEQFGPCGNGWTYTIDKLWTEPGPAETVMAFALVSVKVGTAAPVQGVGGSMMVAKETGGLRANDEAYKMAVTDALSTSLKTLGVAADIYAGLWDGSKYLDAPNNGAPAGSARAVTEDAFKSLPKERQEMITDTATQVVDALNEGRDFDGYALCESLDTEGKLAIWSLFNAEQRRRIKAAKNMETATQA